MKPVVFFSHSSSDRDRIMPIRDKLLSGTGNAIEIFMSSDGSSIPFGRNWLKEIEDALNRCRVMFVWMTPTSLDSKWLAFESGFSYSKGIRVVPVAFQGATLNKVPPPLSILQGFDIADAKSLNNLVAIINEEFELAFPPLFDDAFYTSLHVEAGAEDSPDILRFVHLLHAEFASVTLPDNSVTHVSRDWLAILTDILCELNIPFHVDEGRILGQGFMVSGRVSSEKQLLSIDVDPLALNATRQVWSLARQRLYEGDLTYVIFTPHFVSDVILPGHESLVGARVLNSEVTFDTVRPHQIYRFRNIDFRISVEDVGTKNESRELILLIPRDNVAPIPLYSLLRLLEDRRIITFRRVLMTTD